MKLPSLILTLLLALSCGITFAQDKSKIDWDAEYKRLLQSDPGVLKKIESGQATKKDVIRWLQKTRGEKTKVDIKKPAAKDGEKQDLSAFKKKLYELVKSGKLSKEEAAKLAATMRSDEAPTEQADKKETVVWDAAYEKLLSNPAARQKIERSGATKEQVIEFLKKSAAAKNGNGKLKGGMKVKPGARKGSFQFYSLVIGRLKSKDVELGEMEIDVDYVISGRPQLNADLIGKRVKLVGVSGQYLDALLQIKRGETVQVRTGDFNPETKVLGFGYKFHVLERTAPFKPADFGIPPKEFRGFTGELTGKIVEAAGYEVLLEVQESKPADGSKAKNAQSILGNRIRIAGFYDNHRDQFADLHEGDLIRVKVRHRDSESDALNVTDLFKRVDDGVPAAHSAEPMHTPTKMPIAKAESVGMSSDGLSRINEVLQEHIDAGRIQGAVTIVARRGKVVHFSTHGEMDVTKGRAMESDAIYRMASSTKPVIGVAAMIMADEGLINLNDPISKYIPEFAHMRVAVLNPTSNSSQGNSRTSLKQKNSKQQTFRKEVPNHRLVAADRPLTIHHLLTHTSGLMSGGIGSAVNRVYRTSEDTLETYVAKLAKVPLDFQPGTHWAYGNAGIHAVVPRIIEIVSETPFEEFVRERVLKPLEMNNSHFHLPTDKESKRVVVLFKGQEVKKKNGGTGLSSTAEDYLHFQQMLLNGGELFGNQLLRSESVEMMSSNQVGDLFARGKKGQKGMGFGYTVAVTLDPDAVANHRGKGAFGWGGAGGTMSWTDPDNELVAVIMLQQPRGSMQSDFAKAILEAIIE